MIPVFLTDVMIVSSSGDAAPPGGAAGPAAGQLRWEGLPGREAAEAGRWSVQRARLQPAGERPAGQRTSHQRHPTLQVSGDHVSAQVLSVHFDLHKKIKEIIFLKLHMDSELCRKICLIHLQAVWRSIKMILLECVSLTWTSWLLSSVQTLSLRQRGRTK